ncbi:hypothetical protein, partial [Endozoicomonas sp. ONNA1]
HPQFSAILATGAILGQAPTDWRMSNGYRTTIFNSDSGLWVASVCSCHLAYCSKQKALTLHPSP